MTDQIDNQIRLTRPVLPVRGLSIIPLICAWLTVSSCQHAVRWEESASPPSQQTVGETTKRNSRGNPPFYEVFGQRYYVLASSQGFRERGVASWYGKKFHGRLTSNGDVYDMHAMTAAHKTLPLPTRVRVRNLKNGRSVIVKVNDRGPFVDNRIIDLSYAAATELDMIREGTALVEIEVMTNPATTTASIVTVSDTKSYDLQTSETEADNLFLQVGAFGEQANAQQLLERLHGSGFSNAVIHSDTARVPSMFRVRLGPITNVAEYDALVEKMATLRIMDMHLVSESANTSGT